MAKHELKSFQKRVSNDVIEAAKRFASKPRGEQKVIVIEMPTGMGKTITLADIIERYLAVNYQILVLTPGAGGLDVQTAKALRENISNAYVSLLSPADVGFISTPATKSVIVANWEMLVARNAKTGLYKNKLTRETESYGVFDFLARDGAPVAIIIDEAHHGASKDAQAIQGFLADVTVALGYSPLTIEASATPMTRSVEPANFYHSKATITEGREACLIRSNVVLNDGINDIIASMNKAERATSKAKTVILHAALEKQRELDAAYLAAGSDQHTLIGIQVPNGTAGNDVIQLVKDFFADEGITQESGTLAVYFSKEKDTSVLNIANADSKVRVLIYKQAVSTGWNCPRAQIAVGFRDIKSRVFSIQNRGRFFRTTDGIYYHNPILNATYIYSDEVDFENGLREEGIVDGEWSDSVNLIADEKNLAVFSDAGLYGGWFKRTARESVDSKLVRERMEKFLPELMSHYILFNRKDHGVGRRFGEITIDIETAIGKGFTAVESSESIAEDLNFNDFIDQIKGYIKEPFGSEPSRDFGANHRVAERVRAILNRLLKANPCFVEGIDFGRTDAKQYVISQFASLKGRGGAELNRNAEYLQDYIHKVFTGEGAPASIKTEKDGSDAGSPREQRELKVCGSWTPKGQIIASKNEEYRVTGLRASKRLYQPKSESSGVFIKGKLSKPELLFEENLVGLVARGVIADVWFEHNGTGGGDFVLPVNNGDHRLDFYPDYFGQITKNDGTKEPFIFEVKGEQYDGQDSVAGTTVAKSEALAQYSVKFGIQAGVVYKTDGDWLVLRANKSDVVKFEDYINAEARKLVKRAKIDWCPSCDADIPEGVDVEWFGTLGIMPDKD